MAPWRPYRYSREAVSKLLLACISMSKLERGELDAATAVVNVP